MKKKGKRIGRKKMQKERSIRTSTTEKQVGNKKQTKKTRPDSKNAKKFKRV